LRIGCVGGFPTAFIASLTELADAPPTIFGSADEALRLPRQSSPDVWLTEALLPGVSGFEFARRMSARPQAPPIMMVTALQALWPLARAVRAGARGFLQLPVTTERLAAALDQLLAGGAFRAAPEHSAVDAALRDSGVLDLSPRRFEALHLMLQHESAGGVALAMSINPRSAANYCRLLEHDLRIAGAVDLEQLAALMGRGFYGSIAVERLGGEADGSHQPPGFLRSCTLR
jgi:DNA-binding NarL/FixJ family response regulator